MSSRKRKRTLAERASADSEEDQRAARRLKLQGFLRTLIAYFLDEDKIGGVMNEAFTDWFRNRLERMIQFQNAFGKKEKVGYLTLLSEPVVAGALLTYIDGDKEKTFYKTYAEDGTKLVCHLPPELESVQDRALANGVTQRRAQLIQRMANMKARATSVALTPTEAIGLIQEKNPKRFVTFLNQKGVFMAHNFGDGVLSGLWQQLTGCVRPEFESLCNRIADAAAKHPETPSPKFRLFEVCYMLLNLSGVEMDASFFSSGEVVRALTSAACVLVARVELKTEDQMAAWFRVHNGILLDAGSRWARRMLDNARSVFKVSHAPGQRMCREDVNRVLEEAMKECWHKPDEILEERAEPVVGEKWSRMCASIACYSVSRFIHGRYSARLMLELMAELKDVVESGQHRIRNLAAVAAIMMLHHGALAERCPDHTHDIDYRVCRILSISHCEEVNGTCDFLRGCDGSNRMKKLQDIISKWLAFQLDNKKHSVDWWEFDEDGELLDGIACAP